MMVGAGIVALVQVTLTILRRGNPHAGASRSPSDAGGARWASA